MPSRKSRIKHADIVRAFAERLKAIRLAKGFTQRNVADSASVPLSYISRLEAAGAAPGIDMLERLARALEVPIQKLLPADDTSSTLDDERKKVQTAFIAINSKAGRETLATLNCLFERIAESQSLTR